MVPDPKPVREIVQKPYSGPAGAEAAEADGLVRALIASISRPTCSRYGLLVASGHP
jgi:hypothetical protein